MRLTDKQIAELIELRESGMKMIDIARRLGVSKGAVDWQCLKHAVEKPDDCKNPGRSMAARDEPIRYKRGRHIVRCFGREEDAQLEALRLAGKSLAEIGRLLGRKPNAVRARLLTRARQDERAEMAAAR